MGLLRAECRFRGKQQASEQASKRRNGAGLAANGAGLAAQTSKLALQRVVNGGVPLFYSGVSPNGRVLLLPLETASRALRFSAPARGRQRGTQGIRAQVAHADRSL